MKIKQDRMKNVFVVIVMAILLISCNFSQIRIGEVRMMYGSNEDRHISYNYSTFTGVENGSSEVNAGQIISFEFTVTVDKGSIMIEWQDPDGEVVWRKNLEKSDRGEDAILAESSGNYGVVIQGKNASGDFELLWEIE